MQQHLKLRQLTPDDIPAALQLCRDAGWNQLEADWTRLLHYEPSGCFAAQLPSDLHPQLSAELAGTVTTTCYGTELAWIGMMLVNQHARRRGIGTALMKASLQYLQGQALPCVKLDATPLGQPVYERLGFEAEGRFQRWARQPLAAPSRARAVVHDSLGPDHWQLDRLAFGADRSAWLALVAGGALTVIARGSSFGMLRAGYLADYLGPLVATEAKAAEEILAELLPCSGRQIFWDVPSGNCAGLELAQSCGFTPVRELTRMRLGAKLSHQGELQYALCDPSTG